MRIKHYLLSETGILMMVLLSLSVLLSGCSRTANSASVTDEYDKFGDRNQSMQAEARAVLDEGIALKPSDIDGIACCREEPTEMAYYLGITPKWVDGTAVGGTSFLIHVRHAAAAIASGLCSTVLITHGESGRSNVAKSRPPVHPGSLNE
mgnify:CR=1 FL=1